MADTGVPKTAKETQEGQRYWHQALRAEYQTEEAQREKIRATNSGGPNRGFTEPWWATQGVQNPGGRAPGSGSAGVQDSAPKR